MLLLMTFLAVAPLQDTDTTVAVRAGSRLNLETHEGSITISTWSRSVIRVQATHDADTRIEVENRGGGVYVRGRSRGGPAEVNFQLTVPDRMNLEISSLEGDIRIDNTMGEVNASTTEGNVTLTGGRGRVNLSSVEGEIMVTGAEGKTNLSTVDGAIMLRRGVGDFALSTVDGDITIEGTEAWNLEASTVDGSISFDGTLRDNGRYVMKSHDGDVTVRVPEINAAVSVSTFSGDFASDFPVTLSGRTLRQRLDFTLGNGSSRLELESFDGTVSLQKPGSRPPPRSKEKSKDRD